MSFADYKAWSNAETIELALDDDLDSTIPNAEFFAVNLFYKRNEKRRRYLLQ